MARLTPSSRGGHRNPGTTSPCPRASAAISRATRLKVIVVTRSMWDMMTGGCDIYVRTGKAGAMTAGNHGNPPDSIPPSRSSDDRSDDHPDDPPDDRPGASPAGPIGSWMSGGSGREVEHEAIVTPTSEVTTVDVV